MTKENKIHKVWPVHFGEFYNPNHDEIKSDLITYFKEYIKNSPGGKRSGEFIVKEFLTMAKEVNKNSLEVDENKIIKSANALVPLMENGKQIVS